MSSGGSTPVVIPARISVADFAIAMERPLTEVQEKCRSLDIPSSPGDLLGPEVSLLLARGLRSHVVIESRDLALESLYAIDVHGAGAVPELPPRALAMVEGVLEALEVLDNEIEAASEHWSVARMPLVDRAILRMGLYELKNEPDTPTAVIVSEAVRLAKSYSTERSGSFVNGVLASLARANRR